jgi:hypothetical protein
MNTTTLSTPASSLAVVVAVAAIAVLAAVVTVVSPASEPVVALARVEPATVAQRCADPQENHLNPQPAQPI